MPSGMDDKWTKVGHATICKVMLKSNLVNSWLKFNELCSQTSMPHIIPKNSDLLHSTQSVHN